MVRTADARAGLLLPLLGVLMAAAGCREERGKGVELAPRPAPELEARAVDGQPFRLADQRGRVVVVTFGYTSCPDVCPMTLARLRGLYAKLGEDADRVDTVFISVDPERDTPDRLHAYLRAFSPRVRGLSLAEGQLQQVLAAFEVSVTRRLADPRRYRHVSESTAPAYSIDHTGGYFVVGTDGRLRLHLPHEVQAEEMAFRLRGLLAEEA